MDSMMDRASVFMHERRRFRKWCVTVVCLALVVLVGTLMALRYTGQAMNHTVKTLKCTYKVHEHTAECYNDEHELVCGLADYVVHTHNDDCYNESGELVCPLTEKKEHKHDSTCYTEETTLVCGLEESPGHVHDESCYTAVQGELICTITPEEDPEHVHDDSCYAWSQELTCGLEEGAGGHTHTADCYVTESRLTCGELENHVHDKDKCYDEQGNLTCKEIVLEEHVHGEECFEVIELSAEEVEILNNAAAGRTGEDSAAEEGTTGDGSGTEGAESSTEGSTGGADGAEGSEATEPGTTEDGSSAEGTDGSIDGSSTEGSTEGAEGTNGETAEAGENGENPEGTEGGESEVTEPVIPENAITREYRDESVAVTAYFTEDANIPEEAKLRVRPLDENDAEYAERAEAARQTVGSADSDAPVVIYNIGFYVGDEEVTPESTVTITVQMLDAEGFPEGTPVTVVHFAEDGAEVVRGTDINAEGATTFEADGF